MSYFSAARRCCAAAAVFCAAAALGGCGQNSAPPASPACREAANIACLAAPAAAAPSQQLISRAAALTQARNYRYFLLIEQPSTQKTGAARPQLGIHYGREPYGFGDAGASSPASLGFSFSPSFAAFRQRKRQTEWLVYMLNSAGGQAARELNAAAGSLPLGAAADIYQANAPAAEPVSVRLR